MEIKSMKLEELKVYGNNPRKNDEAVPYVAASIKEFGFKVPIIIDKDNVIIAGHTRYKAAKELKLKSVPVVVADDLTEEQVNAFRLADNRVAEIAKWDEDALKEEMAKVLDVDFESFGFDLDDIEDIMKEEVGIKTHKCPKCGCEWTEKGDDS